MRRKCAGGETKWGQPILGLPHTDAAGWLARAKLAFGTVSAAFAESEIHRLTRALQALRDDLALETKLNAALAVVDGVGWDPVRGRSDARQPHRAQSCSGD